MIEVAAAVIFDGKRVLLASRPADKPPAGWEFPGGKLEKGEDVFAAAKRELIEELGFKVHPEKILYVKRSDSLILHFVRCTPEPGSTPRARENQQFKWVTLSEKPAGLLDNDREFWEFLCREQEKFCTNIENLSGINKIN